MKFILNEKYSLLEKYTLNEDTPLTPEQEKQKNMNHNEWENNWDAAVAKADAMSDDDTLDEILDLYYDKCAKEWHVNKDKIEDLNPAFEQELLHLSFYETKNPFLAFLTHEINGKKPIRDFNLNSKTYGELHNAYVSKYEYNNGDLRSTGLVGKSNIIFCKDLYDKGAVLEKQYLEISKDLINTELPKKEYYGKKSLTTDEDAYKYIMYDDNDNTKLRETNKIDEKIVELFGTRQAKQDYKSGDLDTYFKDDDNDKSKLKHFIVFAMNALMIGDFTKVEAFKNFISDTAKEKNWGEDFKIDELFKKLNPDTYLEVAKTLSSIKLPANKIQKIVADIIKNNYSSTTTQQVQPKTTNNAGEK